MRSDGFDAEDFADLLNGRSTSLETALEIYYPGMELEDLTEGDHDRIDNITAECNTCGWWVDAHEVDESGNCSDCQEPED